MLRYAGRRLFALIPILLVVGVTSFLLVHLTPGSPAAVMLGPDATADQVQQLEQRLGLNQPLYRQFASWSVRVLRGDLGDSFFLNQSVGTAIAGRIPITLILSLLALAAAVALGVPAGVIAAAHRGTLWDQLCMGGALVGLSVPSFWLGINLIILFSVKLGWLPVGGYVPFSKSPGQALLHMTMPAVSLGFIHAALIARMTRSSMLEVLRLEYVRTARAKGLSERSVVYRHALRNAIIPTITVIGLTFGALLGGAVVVEQVFNLPGSGRLVVQAVARRDFPLIQGAILYLGLVSTLVNLAVDLSYAAFNPRIRYQ